MQPTLQILQKAKLTSSECDIQTQVDVLRTHCNYGIALKFEA